MVGASLDSIRVLHVDDEPNFSDLTSKFVERSDQRITVETAPTVSDGLDRLSQAEFDCVVSDFEMPEQNGLEFLKSVRQDFPELPFILFTGKGSEEVASEAISTGVTDYLQKESGIDQYALLANRICNAVEANRFAHTADQRQHRLEQILKTVPGCVVRIDRDGQFVFANRRAKEVLGLEPVDVAERTYNDPKWQITDLEGDPIPDEELPFRQVRDSGEPIYGYRHMIEWPDGTRKALQVNGAPLIDDDGNVRSTVFTLTDITEEVDSIRDTENDYAEIVTDHMQDVALVVNHDQQIVYANQRLGQILPDPSSVIGVDAVKALTALTEDLAVIEEYETALNAVLEDGDERSVTVPVSLPNGEIVLDLRMTTFREDGAIAGAVIIAREITEREQLKDQLLYLNQLLRHDVRSDLSVINGFAELIAEDHSDHTEEVDAIISASQHGFELTQTAEEFITVVTGDESPHELRPIELAPVVQSEVKQTRLIHPAADITISGVLPGVQVQATELLGSVVRNLLRNAVEHNSNPDPTIVLSFEESSDTVELRVADNGSGISDERKSMIFDQREKGAQSAGSGLGLYLVDQVVNECGGEVWITDNEPTGAIFHVTLPKSA